LRLTSSVRAVCALAALLALAIPASASAVPSVYSLVAKTGDAGVTFLTDPTGASLLTTQTQYVVSADGYAIGYQETNGVTTGGVIDYSVLPSAYRAPMTAEQKRTYAPAQTGVQPHATCSGVAALSDGANILAWQRNAGNDPYYDYVPWQKASAGLGDDPTTWIPVVRTATGVDLSALSTTADFTAACVRLGGTYVAADTAAPIANTLIANAVAPLNTQITTLRRARAASDTALATAKAAQAADEAAYQALFTKSITLTLAAKRFAPADGVVMITGSPTDPVSVTLELTKQRARKFGLSSPVLAEADGELNDDGGALLTLKPDASIVKRLELRKGTIPATVNAASGGSQASKRVTLVVQGLSKPKPKAKAKAHSGK